MSFNASNTGKCFEPGWFLADNENCTRETYEASQSDENVVTNANGGKVLPMGALFTQDDENIGFVYEDVDVTTGNMPASIVTSGYVFKDRLLSEMASATEIDLVGRGFKFTTVPNISRA